MVSLTWRSAVCGLCTWPLLEAVAGAEEDHEPAKALAAGQDQFIA